MVLLMQINDSTFLATVRTLAAAFPEKVYSNPVPQTERVSSCLYVHPATDTTPATPGCIIGTALHVLGISLDDLSRVEGTGAYSAINNVLPFEDYVSNSVLEWARTVQMRQDSGKTWAKAVALADERHDLPV